MGPKRTVTITGAAGQVAGYLIPMIASGSLYGENISIDLRLLDIEAKMKNLYGIAMEIQDSAYPLIENITVTCNYEVAFDNTDTAILIGASPRVKGMKRSDLLINNYSIFEEQGKILNKVASKDIKILVVGNPANTNCFITLKNAQDIPKERFSAMTFLDSNRAFSILAKKANVNANDIENIILWGNHGESIYPDVEHAYINDKTVREYITDSNWLENEFIDIVRNRGTEIINYKGLSSGISAAKAIIDNIKCFENPSKKNKWFSSAVLSDGSYGIDEELVFSFPIKSFGQNKYKIVDNLVLNDFEKSQINQSIDQLKYEKGILKSYFNFE